jgi:TM2 domain-containing membrane protein YozV
MEQRTKQSDEKFCSECGEVIKEKAEICPKCGVRQIKSNAGAGMPVYAPNGKSKTTAALLAFFLGGLGVHKFYLGETGMGIVYLIFCWTFIPAIIAFIEFVLLLKMNDEVFNVRYGGLTVTR